MKSPSRHSFIISGLAFLLVFGFAVGSAQAQNREKYIISAEAGGVNMVSGDVLVERKGETEQQELTSTDDLRSGDRVITGQDGRVEVLLNPGSYLRVAENSEFELADASLDNLLIRLIKGSAVIEASGGAGVELSIGIKTPQTEALITRGGVYRFNVNSNHTTEIIVHKGRVQYGAGLTEQLKSGRKVLIGGGLYQIASISKKDRDELDLWSKERAKLLALANHRLPQQRVVLAAFNNFDWSNPHGRLGVWVYSPDVRGYCYLPDGTRVWTSPYGFRYGTGAGYYYACSSCPGSNRQGGGNNYPTTGTTASGNGGGNGGGNSGGNNGGNTTPTYTPPSTPSPPSTPVYTPPPSSPAASGDHGRSMPSRTEQSPNR